MKIYFSPKKKLIKLAEDDRECRLCSTPQKKNSGYLPVIPYSLTGEPTANKIRKREVPGCSTCNSTGSIKSEPPTYRECKTCKPGFTSAGGIGEAPGLYKPRVCPTCYNQGKRLVPVYGGGIDEFEERPCPTCDGKKDNIPVKDCPTCIGAGSDKPGFIQHGESQHNMRCPTCNGSKKRTVASPYTPILQVQCPHLSGVDTFTKPNSENANDHVGPHDRNYFEGQRLLPLRLLWGIRGVGPKYTPEKHENLPLFDGSTREVGVLTPPVPPVQSTREPSYMDFLSRTDLLDPDRSRTANNSFKKIKVYFNSKTAKEEAEPNQSNNNVSDTDLGDDFFGREVKPSTNNDLKDFLPEDFSLPTKEPSKRRVISPEESKRLNGGPVTVRQMDESDMKRPFLRNPAKALEKTRSRLNDQKSLSEKRERMSKMFKGMKSIDDEPDENVREQKRNEGLRPSYRNWRDNLQTVSINLDAFQNVKSQLRKKISPIIGKPMNLEIATALTSQAFRNSKKLSQHRMGIVEPMPYFKNDENWRETHSGLGCDHDPGEGHEPDVGCIIDYHNSVSNPKGGVTTGINQRLVTGKYTREDGKTILQTVGARLKRPTESGLSKLDLRGSTPQWTPENLGRVIELPSDNATCVPNRIQREHYVVNHTVEPASERSETTQLPLEETGIPGLKSEPVLNKEKVKFPEDIRQGGPTESVYVGNPLYQLNNPFSSQEVERGMWANTPAVQHLAKQIRNGKRPEKFKPYTPEPKFNSQQMKTRPGLTGPPPPDEQIDFGGDDWDINDLFRDFGTPPKTSKKESELNPVEENADETYDTDKKMKVQKMQRTQVHMVEPTNASTPDITPEVPLVNYN